MGLSVLIPAVLFVGVLILVVLSLDARRTIKLTRTLAYIFIAIVLVVSIIQIVNLAFSDTLNLTIPVEMFWPAPPESVMTSAQTAQVVGGGVTQATVDIQGITAITRTLLVASVVLQGVLDVVICAAVISLCQGHLAGADFRPGLVKWFSLTATVVIVCGFGRQFLDAVAGYQASRQALGTHFTEWLPADDLPDDLTQIIGQIRAAEFELVVDLWPLWAGLVLFTAAQAFKRGSEIQKDLAGLV